MFDVLGKRPRFSFEKGRGEDSDATFRSFHQAQRYNKKKSEILTQLKQMANGQTEAWLSFKFETLPSGTFNNFLILILHKHKYLHKYINRTPGMIIQLPAR